MTDDLKSPPNSAPVAILDQRRPGFDPELLRDLEQVAGQEPAEAKRFLRPRAAEPIAVRNERWARFYLTRRLAHALQTIASEVFAREPRIHLEGALAESPEWTRILKMIVSAMQAALERALLHGEAQVHVAFPRKPAGARVESLADADALGLRDPTVLVLEPGELRDFDADANGALRWATIGQRLTRRSSPLSAATSSERSWTVLTPNAWAVYVHREDERATASSDKANATLEANGAHAFGRVPLARLSLPARLALGVQLLPLEKQLIELDNALSWQGFMSLYAMPVVKTSKGFGQVMGEGYAIVLEPGDSFDWAEPKGTAIELFARHRDALREELYRVAHVLALGIGADASTAGRSGESKRQDWRATEHTLAHLGALVRDLAVDLVALVAAGRGEKVRATVSGLDSFDLEGVAKRLEEHLLADSLIRSPQWRVERGRSLARRVMPELSEESLATIDAELEAAKDEDGVELLRDLDEDGDE